MSSSSAPQIVLVTGGTRGIGVGIARVFVGAGAAVVVCGRDSVVGEAAATEVDRAGPGSCRFIECDVSKSEDNERLIQLTVETMGRLDCLVNNAGWHPPYVSIDEMSVSGFSDLLRLNLISYFELCKLALPFLRQTRGTIINVSSLVGEIGQEGSCTYTATKGAINALTKSLAIDEARHGVRINAVLPGVIETPLYREYVDTQPDPRVAERETNRWQWMGRVGRAEEVGYLCLFLSGEGASFVTGATIPLSGGAELGYGLKRVPGLS
jgi:NAD(P)-dependent dehydrogenase (short-subunit alcohol dehydrogenase family)